MEKITENKINKLVDYCRVKSENLSWKEKCNVLYEFYINQKTRCAEERDALGEKDE